MQNALGSVETSLETDTRPKAFQAAGCRIQQCKTTSEQTNARSGEVRKELLGGGRDLFTTAVQEIVQEVLEAGM